MSSNTINHKLHDPRRSSVYRSERFGWPQEIQSSDRRVIELHSEIENVWKEWGLALDAAETVNADTTLPADLRSLRIKRAADARIKKVAERVAAAQAKAESEIVRIKSEFQKKLAPKSAADETRRGQLRAALLAMSPEKRGDTIRAAITSQDVGLLDAICSGYAFEHGAAVYLADCQSALHKLQSPDDAEALTLLRSGADHLQRSAFALVDCVASDLVSKDAAAIETRAQAAVAVVNDGGANV